MAADENEILGTIRIGKIVQALQDVRFLPQELVFLSRTPMVPALDDEVIGRFLNQVMTADIVADDQKAPVYQTDRIKFEMTRVPKIKIGRSISESMLQLLNSIQGYGGTPNDQGMYTDYQRRQVQNCYIGVQQRMEALIIAMQMDQLVPAYNKLGIQLSNVSWGMPAELKLNAAVPWSDPVNSTPVQDLTMLALTASIKYGKRFDRVTMSTQCFRTMVKSNEWINESKSWLVSLGQLPPTTPQQSLKYLATLSENILGMEIEFYDSRYTVQNTDGSMTYQPYLPINQVILGSKQNDGNAMVMDFANTLVTETMDQNVPGLVGGGFGAPQYGPVSYATRSSLDLNPPGYVYWCVARGFPRKFELAATATINVGALTDQVTPGVTF